jgi:hypothetical protein
MVNIQQNLKVARDGKKSYAYKNKTYKEFKVDKHVFLKVKDKRILLILGSFLKLAVGYCGSFEYLEKIGPIAYMLALPASMRIHNVFHVSLLNKYIHDPNYVIDWTMI